MGGGRGLASKTRVTEVSFCTSAGLRRERGERGERGGVTKYDGQSDPATDHRPRVFVHSRMVRRPVGRSVVLRDRLKNTLKPMKSNIFH